MSCVVELLRSRFWPLASVLALATGLAGCSGEATRFNENPFTSRGAADGPMPPQQSAPVGRVESQALPPAAAYPAPAANYGTVGGGRGMAPYSPAAAKPTAYPAVASSSLPPPDVTGSVVNQAPRPPSGGGKWTWDGGTPITVAQGDTVDGIARRYGVPPTALMHANNITAQATLYPGQPLVIPRFVPNQAVAARPPPARSASASPLATRPASSTPVAAAGPQGVHVVAPGETLSKISRLYGKPVGEIAKANNIRPTATLKIGDRLTIPGVRTSAAKPKVAMSVAQPKAAAPTASKEGASEPTHRAAIVTPAVEATRKDPPKAAEATGALPTFRWPANGRVIAGFGTSPNGVQNDGINLALPEGTSVKAAEDGVVAYAGNELKGYGNLVLVRHPNGYVTAYAHAKEILVKRGDQVRRGQVIARSGQTGNVNAPQLHFEIRKGASPLDPMRFLKGA
ncbi:MAG: peptidoglycan DD-metalloendopeptidase family protein [Xanthobacteraceae bacterium]